MKKRVLFVTESFGGGVFSYLVGLSNELSDTYDICIAYSLRKQTPSNFTSYFDSRIKFIEVKNFTRNINPYKDIKSMAEIKKIAKEFNPDIIHLHSSKAGVLGRILFSFTKEDLYYTPHGYSFLMKDVSKLKRILYWSIEKIVGFSRSITISCSEGEFRESQKLTKRNRLVNNGIDIVELDKLKRNQKNSTKGKRPTIFTIGRISEQKNPILFNSLAKKFPDIDFLWIGDGNLKSELSADNIEITGWLNRNEALKLAFKSDFFVLTSLWEGLPISLLESMYLEKLCFVSNVIGNRDVIRDRENGFVCNNLNEFVLKIKKSITDLNTNEKLKKSAKQDVLNKYNIKIMSDGYKKIYSGE